MTCETKITSVESVNPVAPATQPPSKKHLALMALSEADRARFWLNVKIKGPDECWPWTAGKTAKGYGCFSAQGKTLLANRVSLTIKLNGFPAHLLACHTCDNPICVNPAQLFAGTYTDNVLDCVKKKRHCNSKKTHCIHGHELTLENIFVVQRDGTTQRDCRECHRINFKKYYHKKKARLNPLARMSERPDCGSRVKLIT